MRPKAGAVNLPLLFSLIQQGRVSQAGQSSPVALANYISLRTPSQLLKLELAAGRHTHTWPFRGFWGFKH